MHPTDKSPDLPQSLSPIFMGSHLMEKPGRLQQPLEPFSCFTEFFPVAPPFQLLLKQIQTRFEVRIRSLYRIPVDCLMEKPAVCFCLLGRNPDSQQFARRESRAKQAGFEDGCQRDVLARIVHGHQQSLEQSQVRVIKQGPSGVFDDSNGAIAQGCSMEPDDRPRARQDDDVARFHSLIRHHLGDPLADHPRLSFVQAKLGCVQAKRFEICRSFGRRIVPGSTVTLYGSIAFISGWPSLEDLPLLHQAEFDRYRLQRIITVRHKSMTIRIIDLSCLGRHQLGKDFINCA